MKSTAFLALLALGSSALADDVALLRINNNAGTAPQFVVIEFYDSAAPATVANFKKLANSKFYNGTAFHRVFPHQLVQVGDPQSKKKGAEGVGTGGPGYTLPAEINSHKHTEGAVAMARLPDKLNPSLRSNGSQFYVTLSPIPTFDGKYTVFGKVTEGIDILDAISRKPTDTNDAPVERVVLESVKIMPREAVDAAKSQAPRVGLGQRLRHLF